MKPLKSARPLSQWLLRLAFMVVVLELYYNTVTTLHFSSLFFWIAVVAIACVLFLLLGGILSVPWMTILSGLFIVAISVYKIIVSFNGKIDHGILIHFLPFALGFYFLCYGNDK